MSKFKLKLVESELSELKKDKDRIEYHPDFIIYEMSRKEYCDFWNSIKNHPKDQLYTDGIQVYPVSWFSSVIQAIKGFLGFENYCQKNKVELTLAKIAYYGYLKGYNTDVKLKEIMDSGPLCAFYHLFSSLKSNEISKKLQFILEKYCRIYSQELGFSVSTNFGGILNDYLILRPLLDELDVQDVNVLEQAVGTCFKNPGRYLDLGLSLIARLAMSPETTHIAIEYASQHFIIPERAQKLANYPELKKALANYYFNLYIQEEKIGNSTGIEFIKNFVTGKKGQSDKYLAYLLCFCPEILSQNDLLDESCQKYYQENQLKLIENAVGYFIQRKQTDVALDLFLKHQGLHCTKDQLQTIETYFMSLYREKESLVFEVIGRGKCDEAERLLNDNGLFLQRHIQAKLIDNSSVFANMARLNRARALRMIDEKKHPEIQGANLDYLDKAFAFVNKISQDTVLSKEVWIEESNQILLRIINHLESKELVPASSTLTLFSDFSPMEGDAAKKYKGALECYIELNQDQPIDPIQLARVYQLLGAYMNHFHGQDSMGRDCIQKALSLECSQETVIDLNFVNIEERKIPSVINEHEPLETEGRYYQV